MKNIEKVAIILIILWVITLVTNPLFRILALTSFIPHEYAELNFFKSTLALSTAILGLIVRIGVAIWLFGLAKRGKETPWVWALFGLTFGLVAAVLFFLLRIYYLLKEKRPLGEISR